MSAAQHWKPYSEYRESGVDWLGMVPKHWRVMRLKNLVKTNLETWPETTPEDQVLRYVDISNVDSLGNVAEGEEVIFAKAPTRARRRARHGDTAISTVRTYLRAIAFIKNPDEALTLSTGFAVLHPGSNVHPRFLYWLARSETFVERVVAHSVGVGYPAISPTVLAALPAWLPPLSEQEAIVVVLDRETTRIDALISKRERLIELLEEERAAQITEAVTKGLDPKVPMKSSQSKWLGMLPAHWRVRRLKWLASIRPSGVDKKTEPGEKPVLLCNYTDVYDHEQVSIETEFMHASATDAEIQRFELRADDVIVTKDSESWDDIAVPAHVPADMPGVICGYHLAIVRPDPRHSDGRFLSYALRADGIADQFMVEANGVTRFALGQDSLGSVLVPTPSLHEQRAIAEYLSRATGRINTLVARIRDDIERLKEYRTALVTAAVTGQIDVREAAA